MTTQKQLIRQRMLVRAAQREAKERDALRLRTALFRFKASELTPSFRQPRRCVCQTCGDEHWTERDWRDEGGHDTAAEHGA